MLADAAVESDRVCVGAGGAERGEERQQMFVPRVGPAARSLDGAIVEQLFVRAPRQPGFIAEPYVKAGRLRPILRRFADTPLGIYTVLPGNRYVPQRVRRLIERLAAALG